MILPARLTPSRDGVWDVVRVRCGLPRCTGALGTVQPLALACRGGVSARQPGSPFAMRPPRVPPGVTNLAPDRRGLLPRAALALPVGYVREPDGTWCAPRPSSRRWGGQPRRPAVVPRGVYAGQGARLPYAVQHAPHLVPPGLLFRAEDPAGTSLTGEDSCPRYCVNAPRGPDGRITSSPVLVAADDSPGVSVAIRCACGAVSQFSWEEVCAVLARPHRARQLSP